MCSPISSWVDKSLKRKILTINIKLCKLQKSFEMVGWGAKKKIVIYKNHIFLFIYSFN